MILLFSILCFADDSRRAEGRVHEMSFWDMAGYAWKNLAAPERDAPSAVKEYFDAQRSLTQLPKNEKVDVRLAFVGDLMWARSGWDNLLSLEVKSLLAQTDGIVGNLETVLSPRFAVKSFWPDLVHYNSPVSYLSNFEHDGKSQFAALSTANNHTLDYGDEGAEDTFKTLTSLGIPQSGIQLQKGNKTWIAFERKGIKFGFFAATFGFNDSNQKTNLQINVIPGLAPEGQNPELKSIESALNEMHKEKIDIKIISLHWGHEFEYFPTASQMTVSKDIVSMGADILLGSHSHVQQPDETCFLNGYEKQYAQLRDQSALSPHHGCVLKDKSKRPRKARIIYSMGNFTTAMIPEYNRVALLKEIEFFKSENGIDWNDPKNTLLYNDGASIFGERKLELLDSVLGQRCGKGFWNRACPKKLLEVRGFLRSHLFGEHAEEK